MIKKTVKHSMVVAAGTFLLFFAISCGAGSAGKAGVSNVAKASTLKKGPLPDLSVKGEVFRLPGSSTLETVDPQLAIYSNSFEIIGCYLEGLMTPASDGSVAYALCKEEIVSNDGLKYIFKLRDDSYWTNGDPVTAHDFVYAWQRAVDPAVASDYAFLISDIAKIKNGVAVQAGIMDVEQLGVKALDNYTLQVELTVPVPFFEQLLYFCTFYPVNQKFVESLEVPYGSSLESVMGNGAFVMTEWNEEKVVLVKNTAYYNADQVKLGSIEYITTYDTTQARVDAYIAGDLDYVQINSTFMPDWKDKSDFHLLDSGFLHYVSFNLTDKVVSNRNLRLALTMSFDREELILNRLKNGSKPAYVPVPSGYSFDSKGKDFSKEGVEFPGYCEYNPQLALEYFKKAQKELGTKNITISFMCVENTTQASLAKIMAEDWEKNLPGLKVEFDYCQKSSEGRKRMSQGNYQFGFTNWGPDYADPLTYLSMWTLGNSQNVERYNNPQYEALIARCSEGDLCTKPDERLKALKEAECMIVEEAIVMPVYQQCDSVILNPKVKNLDFHAIALNKVFKTASK